MLWPPPLPEWVWPRTAVEAAVVALKQQWGVERELRHSHVTSKCNAKLDDCPSHASALVYGREDESLLDCGVLRPPDSEETSVVPLASSSSLWQRLHHSGSGEASASLKNRVAPYRHPHTAFQRCSSLLLSQGSGLCTLYSACVQYVHRAVVLYRPVHQLGIRAWDEHYERVLRP